ncbi:MAG: hypothetical protein IPM79_08275 [Polyangiaceae bacterium]|nr:hypothetical protein [Polyangiaceae bacterium]
MLTSADSSGTCAVGLPLMLTVGPRWKKMPIPASIEKCPKPAEALLELVFLGLVALGGVLRLAPVLAGARRLLLLLLRRAAVDLEAADLDLQADQREPLPRGR